MRFETFERGLLQSLKEILPEAMLLVEGRTGGYFCMANHVGTPLLIFWFGEMPREKARKYFHLCQEKAARLALHYEHCLSFESRDPGLDRWGGAVRTRNGILSFSGFPEDLDEAAMLVLSLVIEGLSEEDAARFAQLSQNQYFPKLQEAVAELQT